MSRRSSLALGGLLLLATLPALCSETVSLDNASGETWTLKLVRGAKPEDAALIITLPGGQKMKLAKINDTCVIPAKTKAELVFDYYVSYCHTLQLVDKNGDWVELGAEKGGTERFASGPRYQYLYNSVAPTLATATVVGWDQRRGAGGKAEAAFGHLVIWANALRP